MGAKFAYGILDHVVHLGDFNAMLARNSVPISGLIQGILARKLSVRIGRRVDILLRNIPKRRGNVGVISNDSTEFFLGPDVECALCQIVSARARRHGPKRPTAMSLQVLERL